MGKPKAPKPPDPKTTAAAQTGTNVDTAIANAFLTNPTMINPYGSTSMTPTGSFDWTNSYTGQTYSVPTFTSTTNLTPAGQALFDLNLGTEMNMGQLAYDQSASLNPYFNSRVDLSGDALAARGLPGLDMSGLGAPGSNLDTSLGAIRDQMGGGFAFSGLPDVNALKLGNEATEARLFELGSNRLNERFDREGAKLDQALADKGISIGSDAYSTAMSDFGDMKNDAYNQLLFTGRGIAGQELKDEFSAGMGLRNLLANEQLGAFGANTGLRGQAFGEITGGAGADAALRGQLANELMKQFDADMAARSGAMTEQLAERNQPLNELNAFMSGSQVTVPNFGAPRIGSAPTTDVAGIINQDFANRMGLYNQQMAGWNNLWGGLLSAGGTLGGYAMMSDKRLKENEKHVGYGAAGLPVYEFNYKADDDKTPRLGYMAQDVEQVAPEAVFKTPAGKGVDLDALHGPGDDPLKDAIMRSYAA